MPRYLIERSFPDGLDIPINDTGMKAVASVVTTNADLGVTWLHSYVGDDNRKTFCIYDGPSPEAIRQVAQRNGLPRSSWRFWAALLASPMRRTVTATMGSLA